MPSYAILDIVKDDEQNSIERNTTMSRYMTVNEIIVLTQLHVFPKEAIILEFWQEEALEKLTRKGLIDESGQATDKGKAVVEYVINVPEPKK